jgi:hypothetical protein
MDIKITGLDDLVKKLDSMAKAASGPEMAARMRQVRCPDHHVGPTNVRVVGDEAHAEFCCEKARSMAVSAVSDPIFSEVR